MIELKSIELLDKVFSKTPEVTSLESNIQQFTENEVGGIVNELLPRYADDKTVVLGMDLYKYSKMEPNRQALIPFVLDALRLATISDLVNGVPFVFQNWKINAPKMLKSRTVDTGDGCFLIFENHIEALCFLIMFQSKVLLFNSNKLLPAVKAFVGEITIRFAVTFDALYKYNGNFYGNAIIKNARILSKDKLNRVLIDKATHSWYLERFSGIENLVNFEAKTFIGFPEFSNYAEHADPDTFFFVDKEKFPREGIRNCQCSQLENIREKEDEYSAYCLYIQVNIGIIANDKTHYFQYSIGNTNTLGI